MLKNLNSKILIFCFLTGISKINAQEAPSWVNFCQNSLSGDLQQSTLLDYSFAGYHHSEREVPDVSSWNTISVTEHGAIPNDENFDDAGIQAAINAAEATGIQTVVYFPPGRYKISSEFTYDTPITVSKSFIVLKGAGHGVGETEIYAEKMGDVSKRWNTSWNIQFIPSTTSGNLLTDIKNRIDRGDREIIVDNASQLSVGMPIVINQHSGTENVSFNMPGLTLKSSWEKIHETGMRITEKHIITAINGNTITLKRPVNAVVTADLSRAYVERYPFVEEVGVEDILFTSGWKEYPENFAHHANDIVDYGWRALRFDNVRNGWIKNVEFRDWNECLSINRSMAVTVEDVKFSGKQGHASCQIGWSTDVLVQNCEDVVPKQTQFRGGQWHGPGLQVRSTGCVYLNFKMQHHQFVDFHGYQPYGNLMDNIQGGILDRNGGAEISQPHSGPDLTFWNFVQNSDYTNKTYNFWDLSRKTQNYFVHPKFIGFKAPGENINFVNVGLNELQGVEVYPKSLFDAQLQLRLFRVYASASSHKSDFVAKNVVNHDSNDYWSPDGDAVGSYLMLDFGRDKYLDGIMLKEVSKAINTFRLECLINGEWESFQPTLSSVEEDVWLLNNTITTRKVKLIIEEVVANTEIQVLEFKAVESDEIPSNNFTISTIGETCVGKKNGEIQITSEQNRDYTLSFDGSEYVFTDSLQLQGIESGTYTLCIRTMDIDFEQCYEVTIEGGVDLSGKMVITKQSAHISVTQGTAPYSVLKNGVFMFETYSNNFSLDVVDGDEINVASEKACEGVMSKHVNFLDSIVAYPNPSNGRFEIFIPGNYKEIAVEIYNIHAQMVSNINYNVSSGKFEIDIMDHPAGIYFIKMNIGKPFFLKVVKQ